MFWFPHFNISTCITWAAPRKCNVPISINQHLQVKISIGGAWYSQMCSQTGCLLPEKVLIQECMMTSFYKTTSSCLIWIHFLTLFLAQPQVGSHTRVATCAVILIVGTWLPTGLLWVSLEQLPILIHARPFFKGEIDRDLCTLYLYRPA